MHASVRSAAVNGIEAYTVLVEVDVQTALPDWSIVGVPAIAVRESRRRVQSALANSGFTLPPRRVTVNLAPAGIPKQGTAFDLPIALAVLGATEQLDPSLLADAIVVGELGLNGSVREIRGALPIARLAADTRHRWLIVPPANLREATLVATLARTGRLATATTLATLVETLRVNGLKPAGIPPRLPAMTDTDVDFADVVGQPTAKRALEVAAAGGHNVNVVGPPGAGKTMLARRLPTILPALTEAEALDVIAIHSVAGLLSPDTPLPPPRPFRTPHHTVSTAGLVGGGTNPRPGEVSLAHLGVLFLDELLEFPRSALEALRQPIEDGYVTITRAARAVSYPARFTLVAAANPCPCGHCGDGTTECRCTSSVIQRYQSRLSGPLADRIDMHVAVPAVPIDTLAPHTHPAPESSAVVRARVESARTRQRARYRAHAAFRCNAHASGTWIDGCTPIAPDARALLTTIAKRFALSARGYHRTLKVARTIADLDDERAVTRAAVAEAIRYRLPLA